MFNISYVPESICNLTKALNIGMSAGFDYQKEIVQYRFWTADEKHGYQFDLPVSECLNLDRPFDFTTFLVNHLTVFLNDVERDRQIEEYQNKDLENTKKVLNSIYGRKAFEERFGYLDVDDVLFDSLNEATLVIYTLKNIIKEYGCASVADFYDISGVRNTNYTNNFYVWKNLNKVCVVKVQSGKYAIRFPKAIRIE